MNCIDAIEGSAKNIIIKLHEVFVKDELDDTEYIRNVKATLDGIIEFVRSNQEIISDPKILKQVLYEFSRELWISELKKRLGQESITLITYMPMVHILDRLRLRIEIPYSFLFLRRIVRGMV